jgi:hypothetical protein
MIAKTRIWLFFLIIATHPDITFATEPTFRLAPHIKALHSGSTAYMLPLSTERPPHTLAYGAEVVLVSGYEPLNRIPSGFDVHVHVNRPKSNILLILTSYRKINWYVTASAQTTITGIIASGYEPSTVTTTASTVGFSRKLPYSYKTGTVEFLEILQTLDHLFGKKGLDAFFGEHSLPGMIDISSIVKNDPRLTLKSPSVKNPSSNFIFTLLNSDLKKVQWVLNGPIDRYKHVYLENNSVALSDDGTLLFRIDDNRLNMTDLKTGVIRKIPPPVNFPKLSCVSDMTFDSKRRIVSVASQCPAMFISRFDASIKSWVDYRTLRGLELIALNYDKLEDRYVGLTRRWDLYVISENGSSLLTHFSEPYISELIRPHAKGEPIPCIKIVSNRNDIALIIIYKQQVSQIWHYSSLSGDWELTYKTIDFKDIYSDQKSRRTHSRGYP